MENYFVNLHNQIFQFLDGEPLIIFLRHHINVSNNYSISSPSQQHQLHNMYSPFHYLCTDFVQIRNSCRYSEISLIFKCISNLIVNFRQNEGLITYISALL